MRTELFDQGTCLLNKMSAHEPNAFFCHRKNICKGPGVGAASPHSGIRKTGTPSVSMGGSRVEARNRPDSVGSEAHDEFCLLFLGTESHWGTLSIRVSRSDS